jgi:hypothetical protein
MVTLPLAVRCPAFPTFVYTDMGGFLLPYKLEIGRLLLLFVFFGAGQAPVALEHLFFEVFFFQAEAGIRDSFR